MIEHPGRFTSRILAITGRDYRALIGHNCTLEFARAFTEGRCDLPIDPKLRRMIARAVKAEINYLVRLQQEYDLHCADPGEAVARKANTEKLLGAAGSNKTQPNQPKRRRTMWVD